MAAGAYKGLTIRIGADTTKLTTGLRGANSAIYKTQSELNKLNKALKLDPGNQNAAQLQLGALASQATNVAREISVLKQGIGELGTTQLSSGQGSVAQLAAETASATLAAEDAKREYTETNAELERMYETFTKLSAEAGNGLTFGNAEGEVNDYGEIANELYEIAAKGGLADDVLEKIAQDSEGAAKFLSDMRANGELTTEALSELTAKAESLKDQWTDSRGAIDDYANVAKLEELNVKLAEAESKLKAVANAFATAAMKSDIAKGLQPMQDKLDQISRATETAKDRFDRLDKAAKLNPNSIMTAADRARALREATDAARQKAQALREQIDAYKAEGIDRIANRTQNAAIAFEQAKSKVADLKMQLEQVREEEGETSDKARELESALSQALSDAKTAGAVTEYRNLQTQLREVQAESKSMGGALANDLQSVGTAAVNAAIEVGNLMKQVGSKIIDASTEVDSAYRDMRKTVDATEEQYKELYDAAMAYSQTHVTSADTMLEMEALAGQVGITADALQGFAEVAANLDISTDIDAETIALQMGQIVNVMSDLKPDNVQGFADALVALGNNMPAQESSIMQISQRLSSIGDVAGFSTPEILGWASAIASTGQRSEAAATGISNTITSITSAVSAGGDELDAFAGVVGMAADDFKKAWGEDASGVLRDFIGEIGNLGPDAIAQLDELGISGIRQTQTLLGLARTVENVDKAMEISQGAWDRYESGNPINGIGEAADEADKKAQGFSGSMSKLNNSIQVLAATFGENLAPYIDMATDAIQKLTDYIENMDDATKDAVVKWGAISAAIATVYPIASKIGGVFLNLAGNIRTLVVSGLGGLIAGAGDAKAAIQLMAEGASPISVFSAQFPKLAAGASAFTTKLTALATSGSVLTGIFGGVALVTLGHWIKYFAEAAIESAKFDGALDAMHGSLDGISADLIAGTEAASDYGKSWQDTKVNMDDFIGSMKDHAKNMSETRDEATASIGELNRYKEIIDKAAGAGDDYAGSQLELKTAIEGVNEILGTSYDKNDILYGVYDKETGAVRNLRDEIDQLIESKKREIRVSAMEDIYKEAVTAQAEAENAYEKARQARRKYVKEFKESHKDDLTVDQNTGETRTLTDQELTALARGTSEYKDLAQAVDETKLALRDCNDVVDLAERQWEGYADKSAFLTSAAFGEREGIIMTTRDITEAIIKSGEWGSKLEDIQDDAKNLAEQLQNVAHVGSTEFAELARQSPEKFNAMFEESKGDIEKLAQLVSEWNKTQLEKKYGEIEWSEDGWSSFVDKQGILHEWDGNEYVAKVDVDTTAVSEGKAEAEAEINSTEGDITIGGDATKAEEAKNTLVDDVNSTEADVNMSVDTAEADAEKNEFIESADGQTITVPMEIESSDVSAGIATAGGEGITVPLTLDTSPAQEAISALSSSAEISVTATADTSAIQDVNNALGQIDRDIEIKFAILSDPVVKASERIQNLNAAANKMAGAKAIYTASGNATGKTPAKNINALNSAASSMSSKSATYTANGNAATSDAPANHIWNLVRAIDSLPREKTTTITTNYVTRGSKSDDGPHASGTYVNFGHDIPKHASGIFTRPTLTNIGWVGEDGAELWSGNSLIPLTNRKYSMPYINDISDAVASKLGDGRGQTVVYVTVSGVVGPDDTADAIARKLELLDL